MFSGGKERYQWYEMGYYAGESQNYTFECVLKIINRESYD